MKTKLFICLLNYLFIGLLPQHAMADTISNNNYSINVDKINTNPQPSPQPQVLGVSHMRNKTFTTGHNYTVKNSKDSFSINLSQDIIDYGILSSTNPVLRTSRIAFNNPSAGAEILTFENHPLQSSTNDRIQNTSCDNGACTPITAATWTNTLTYGFGYRCESNQPDLCDTQFIHADYYKQYPDDSINQEYQLLLLSQETTGKETAQITDKVNISGTQKTGAYYNSITYLAIPNF